MFLAAATLAVSTAHLVGAQSTHNNSKNITKETFHTVSAYERVLREVASHAYAHQLIIIVTPSPTSPSTPTASLSLSALPSSTPVAPVASVPFDDAKTTTVAPTTTMNVHVLFAPAPFAN
ncbi:hypothetical protein B0H19DRAFT_1385325 [Mycena capillaripes]|nr:hypothetical protein B0H19DRAFT_1385325 [Mycena capillaripes]